MNKRLLLFENCQLKLVGLEHFILMYPISHELKVSHRKNDSALSIYHLPSKPYFPAAINGLKRKTPSIHPQPIHPQRKSRGGNKQQGAHNTKISPGSDINIAPHPSRRRSSRANKGWPRPIHHHPSGRLLHPRLFIHFNQFRPSLPMK